MHYLMFIVSDGNLTDARRAAIDRIDEWVQDMDERGVRLLGRPLALPETALTVRVRDGETLVSDGPFTESKEFVGGLNLLRCADLDEALDVAAGHPWCTVASEVRPLPEGFALPPRAREWAAAHPTDSWCAFFCLDGIPEAAEAEARIRADAEAWGRRWEDHGALVCGSPVGHADTATTLREGDGEVLLSDGPFVEAKEFIGGFAVLQGLGRDEVVAAVAEHPLAAYHRVEIRPFMDR